MPINLKELPFVYENRLSKKILKRKNNIKCYNKEKIQYIRDAKKPIVYFVICGGSKNNIIGNMVRKEDQIIFNGNDEYGFDMGIVKDIGKEDFKIQYLELLGEATIKKSRNINRLSPPEDFTNNIYNFNGKKIKMFETRFMKNNECEKRKWFLVLHTMTEQEYIDEVEMIS